jgi:hypothetical protein
MIALRNLFSSVFQKQNNDEQINTKMYKDYTKFDRNLIDEINSRMYIKIDNDRITNNVNEKTHLLIRK